MPKKSTIRQLRYDKTHTTQMMLKFNNTLDADILERLNEVDNRQGYIKRLIRNDLETGMPFDEPVHTAAE